MKAEALETGNMSKTLILIYSDICILTPPYYNPKALEYFSFLAFLTSKICCILNSKFRTFASIHFMREHLKKLYIYIIMLALRQTKISKFDKFPLLILFSYEDKSIEYISRNNSVFLYLNYIHLKAIYLV